MWSETAAITAGSIAHFVQLWYTNKQTNNVAKKTENCKETCGLVFKHDSQKNNKEELEKACPTAD